MITAVSILGSFDEVGGLFLDGDPGYALLDMVQTQTSISLVAVATSDVIEGTSGADTIDMSAATETFVIAGEDDDVIVNIRSGDTAYGQAGDDTFELSAIDVKRIDGGEGIDSIVLPDVAESFIFLASTGWHGTTFDNIEVLRMDDASEQTLLMEAADISRIIDGENELVDDATALVVVGNIGDRIDLYGDFATGEDRYVEIDGTPTLFSEVSEDDVSLYFDQNTSVYVHENDNGTSIYGNAEGEVLTGTAFDETLSGRQGDDDLDAGLGMDVQLGGDGNDHIKYDGADTLIDGGRGVDTVIVSGSFASGSVDLSGVDNLENIEILDMGDNGTADTIELNLSDVLDIVGDNSLSGYEVDSDNKVLVIKGDAEDTVVIDGLDLDLMSPDESNVDLFGDGELYYLYQDPGVSVYVHSDLVDSAASPQAMGLDSYIHNSSVDAFGII
jgi:Ca2+-binding RTX toxin-like protein